VWGGEGGESPEGQAGGGGEGGGGGDTHACVAWDGGLPVRPDVQERHRFCRDGGKLRTGDDHRLVRARHMAVPHGGGGEGGSYGGLTIEWWWGKGEVKGGGMPAGVAPTLPN